FRSSKRQGDVERAPLSRLALEGDLSVHDFDQLGTNCESQSGASVLASHGIVCLGKGFENQLLFILRDAYARIRDAETKHGFFGRLELASDMEDDAAFFGKFD